MNPSLAFRIIELALSLAQAELHGKTEDNAAIAGTLLEIRPHILPRLDPSVTRSKERFP